MLLTSLLQPCSSRYAALTCSIARAALLPSTRPISTSLCWRQETAAQPQTPATESIELSAPVVYISESQDPWFNLSYEDWLMRNTPVNQPVLFMYRNLPCVVIGRNQNPWKETTPRKLKEADIPLVRRRSGGGTVYHDMGNTNFSIILPRLLFTRSHGAELVARAVRDRLGVPECTVNKRFDVVINHQGQDLKMSLSSFSLTRDRRGVLMSYVSGSAYKIIQHRAYHHGTMLISSDISELGKSLKSSSPNLDTKGVPSFRSPVTTLNSHLSTGKPEIDHDAFVSAVTKEFELVYADKGKAMETRTVSEDKVQERKVWDGVEELKSWEWKYGQTPEFTNSFEGDLSMGKLSVNLSSRHALITSLTFHLAPSTSMLPKETTQYQTYLDALALSFVGKRYESLEEAEGPIGGQFKDDKWRVAGEEVIAWLRHAM